MNTLAESVDCTAHVKTFHNVRFPTYESVCENIDEHGPLYRDIFNSIWVNKFWGDESQTPHMGLRAIYKEIRFDENNKYFS